MGMWLIALMQQLQDRQGEARGLAGTGLGRGHHVTPGQHRGNGLSLDRGRLAIAFFLDCARQGRGQAKLVKCHGDTLYSKCSAPGSPPREERARILLHREKIGNGSNYTRPPACDRDQTGKAGVFTPA